MKQALERRQLIIIKSYKNWHYKNLLNQSFFGIMKSRRAFHWMCPANNFLSFDLLLQSVKIKILLMNILQINFLIQNLFVVQLTSPGREVKLGLEGKQGESEDDRPTDTHGHQDLAQKFRSFYDSKLLWLDQRYSQSRYYLKLLIELNTILIHPKN